MIEYDKIEWSGEKCHPTHHVNKALMVPIVYTYWSDVPIEVKQCWTNIWKWDDYYNCGTFEQTGVAIFTVKRFQELIQEKNEWLIDKYDWTHIYKFTEGVDGAVFQYLNEFIVLTPDTSFAIAWMFD